VRRQAVGKLLSTALDAALAGQTPAARAYLRRERTMWPDRSLAEHVAVAERRFVAAVTAVGAAAGAAAAAPGVGTVAGAATNLAEIGAFVEANVFYVLVVAEIHDALPDDPARVRALVLAVLLGDVSEAVVRSAGKLGRYWGREFAQGLPTEAIELANSVLGKRFMTRWGTRQGALLLGREFPVLIGAAIGGVGNRVIARKVVGSVVAEAFGPAPPAITSRGSGWMPD
jgi:hypothetical protein